MNLLWRVFTRVFLYVSTCSAGFLIGWALGGLDSALLLSAVVLTVVGTVLNRAPIVNMIWLWFTHAFSRRIAELILIERRAAVGLIARRKDAGDIEPRVVGVLGTLIWQLNKGEHLETELSAMKDRLRELMR